MNYTYGTNGGGHGQQHQHTADNYSSSGQWSNAPARRAVQCATTAHTSMPSSNGQAIVAGQYTTMPRDLSNAGQYVSAGSVGNVQAGAVRYPGQSQTAVGYNYEMPSTAYQVTGMPSNLNKQQLVSNRSQESYNYGTTLQIAGPRIIQADQSSMDGSNRKVHVSLNSQFQAQASPQSQPAKSYQVSSSPSGGQVSTIVQASTGMDEVFNQMKVANDQIRTLVQESDKLIGVAKQFKKGLEQRTSEYLDLKQEVDMLKGKMKTLSSHQQQPLQNPQQLHSALKQRSPSDASQPFSIHEREQLLEIIEQQRLEIEKLTSKKKKRKAEPDQTTVETNQPQNQVSMGELHSQMQEVNTDDLVDMVRPKRARKTQDVSSHRENAMVITNSMELQPTTMIKPKRKSTENTGVTRKYR